MGSLLVTGKRLGYLAFLSLALATLHASHARPNDSDALWNIVNQECVPNQQKHADPAPCSEVSISNGVERGFAVLKDNAASKPYAFLLIPTRRITGIESPFLLAPDAPNYFQFAWTARSYVLGAVHTALAWDMIGLAVNSAKFRTQSQFHIHVDCVRLDIRILLKEKEQALTDRWSELEMSAPDHAYMALKLSGESLDQANPFRMLADGKGGAREHMDLETLVVVGAVFKDGSGGFYVLSSRAAGLASAHGEDLLDSTCRLAASAR